MDHSVKPLLLSTLLSLAGAGAGHAAEVSRGDLPFDRNRINRYSLDHLPRSISIRQGHDVWLGYDLPRATPYKVWRAPPGESGLKQSGFVTRSMGKTLFEDKSDEPWRLRRDGETSPVSIRYLGCSELEGHFELRWELTHDAGVLTLRERVPMTADNSAMRQIRVESLPTGACLLLPLPAPRGWNLMTAEGTPAPGLTDTQWYQLTLR